MRLTVALPTSDLGVSASRQKQIDDSIAKKAAGDDEDDTAPLSVPPPWQGYHFALSCDIGFEVGGRSLDSRLLFLLDERSLNLLLGLLMLEKKDVTSTPEPEPFPNSIRPEALGSPALMNALNTGVLILDKQKRVVACNTWLQAELRKPLHQVIATDFTSLVHQNGDRLEQCVQDALEWGLPSVLSPAIEGPVLSLHPPHDRHAVIDQQVTISELQSDGRQYCLIQVVDMSIVVSRERMLRQKAEDARAAERALEKANATLLELATRDGLTGIANRRCFDDHFTEEWHRGVRNQTPLSTIMIDIDHFKLLNDKHGHQVGDECLRRVAAALKEVIIRRTDLIARYGGEEFVALLPNTDMAGAELVAERLRAAVEGIESDNEVPGCTISVGVAVCQPSPTGNAAELLQHADAALYEGKEGGRNRVVAAVAA